MCEFWVKTNKRKNENIYQYLTDSFKLYAEIFLSLMGLNGITSTERKEKNEKSEFLKHDVMFAVTKAWIGISTGVIIIDSNSYQN